MAELFTLKNSMSNKITAWCTNGEFGNGGAGQEVVSQTSGANAVHVATMRILKAELAKSVLTELFEDIALQVMWGPISAAWKPADAFQQTVKRMIGAIIDADDAASAHTDSIGGIINGTMSRVRIIGMGSVPLQATLGIRWNMYVHRKANYACLLAESDGRVNGRNVSGTVLIMNRIDQKGNLLGSIYPIFTKKFNRADAYEEA